MKRFNIKSRWSGFWTKGIKALLLLVVLQAESCPGLGWRQCGGAGHAVINLDNNKFKEDLENKKDITCLDEKGKTILLATVQHNDPKKLQITLDQYVKDNERVPPVPHKNTDFMNSPDPKSKNTPILEAIIKGYIEVFNILTDNKYNKYIDINRASKGITPLIATFKYKRHKMANTLLNHASIDIKTIDPTSGNTPLHWAICNKLKDPAIKLIDRLEAQTPELLFEQNKDGDTPLHSAMQYELPSVQSSLIQLALQDQSKLWIRNNKGQTPMDLGLLNKQENVKKLINQMPINQLCAKNEKDNNKTVFHAIALAHKLADPSFKKFKLEVFKSVLARALLLIPDKVIGQFFEETKDGKTVWSSIYLSGSLLEKGVQPVFPEENVEMFKHAINTLALKANLTKDHQNRIIEEIKDKKATKWFEPLLGKKLTKSYVDKLCNIVNDKH